MENKLINGTDRAYFVCVDGAIYSTYTNKAMRQRKEKNGYLSVALLCNGKKKQHSVHRLVAKAFIPNPENKREVNHINGIKTDNRINNLEWNTRSENNKHAFVAGLKKGTNKGVFRRKYYNSKDIIFIKDCIVLEFFSQKDCARHFGVHKAAVQNAIKRKTKFQGGSIYV